MGSETCREEYWSELNDSKKIERTRQRVKNAEEEIKRLGTIIRKLKHHSHQDGGIVVPYPDMENFLTRELQADPEKV